MTQGFTSADWDSVPDISVDGRTICKYSSVAPNGGGWHEYFAAYKASIKPVEVEADPDEDDSSAVYKNYGPVIILEEAEEFDEPCGPLAAWIKLAHKSGWEILSIARARSMCHGLPFSSGAKAGQPRPDYNIDTQWAHFKRNKERASVIYTIINGTVRGPRVGRYYNGEPYGDSAMKEKMK